MAQLSDWADRTETAWLRFPEACRREVTTVTVPRRGTADREWLPVASLPIDRVQWPAACGDPSNFTSLLQQLKVAVCRAEDLAHRAFVYPGTRRDIRHRYSLDWSGWDSVCGL